MPRARNPRGDHDHPRLGERDGQESLPPIALCNHCGKAGFHAIGCPDNPRTRNRRTTCKACPACEILAPTVQHDPACTEAFCDRCGHHACPDATEAPA